MEKQGKYTQEEFFLNSTEDIKLGSSVAERELQGNSPTLF